MPLPSKIWFATALLVASGAAASARNAVIDSNLNLRAGPGPMHRVLVMMPAGTTVKVGECGPEWCQIEYRGQRGYASSGLIKGGDAAYAAAPVTAAAPASTKYDPDDAVRVLNWNDREWRDRYWREKDLRRPQ